jgi:AcrR family transcriptional regulator
MSRSKVNLLEAADRVVLRDGLSALTLDAVAQEAGVSKGGLLYHYGSKEALVEALLERHFAPLERALQRAETDVRPGAWTRAYIRATFGEAAAPDASTTGLLAAFVLYPSLLDGVREQVAAWHERSANDGIEPALATLLRLAADGLWINEVFGLSPLTPAAREALERQMLELTQPSRETP